MQRRPRTLIRALTTLLPLVAVAAGMSGCVTSEASRYQRTMSGRVAPDRRVNADVAAAFGLRDGTEAVSLGATDQ